MSKSKLTKNSTRGGNTKTATVGDQAVKAVTELFTGMSGAFAQGFRSFGEEISSRGKEAEGLTNSVVRGLLVGNAAFFEEAAKTARKISSQLFHEEQSGRDK